MWKDRTIGGIVMVAGVTLVDMVYVWDVVVLRQPERLIDFGWHAWPVLVIANIVFLGGLVMTLTRRSPPQSGSSEEPATKANSAAERGAGQQPAGAEEGEP